MENPCPETWGLRAIEDLTKCVDLVHRRFPDSNIFVAGFSMGGVVTQSYLGGSPHPSVVAGASLSGLFDASRIYESMSAWRFPPYDIVLMKALKLSVGQHFALLDKGLGPGSDLAAKLANKHICLDWHHEITRHFAGDRPGALKDVAAYFAMCGDEHNRRIPRIAVPTLCMISADDPLCPHEIVVKVEQLAAESEGVFVLRTQRGGHCGWFEGAGGSSWADEAVASFFRAALAEKDARKKAD